MTRKRRRYLPIMMRLMQPPINARMVLPAMDPIDQAIREQQKPEKRKDGVKEGVVGDVVVEFGVATDFAEEPGDSEEGHDWHALHGQRDFLRFLENPEKRVSSPSQKKRRHCKVSCSTFQVLARHLPT